MKKTKTKSTIVNQLLGLLKACNMLFAPEPAKTQKPQMLFAQRLLATGKKSRNVTHILHHACRVSATLAKRVPSHSTGYPLVLLLIA